jgi:TonB family protein
VLAPSFEGAQTRSTRLQQRTTVLTVHCATQTPRYSGLSPIKLSTPMRLNRKLALNSLAAIASLASVFALSAAPGTPANDAAPSSPICPIVYPVDQSPSTKGYQYIFFGNAFFINNQGYLLTAAHVLSAFRSGGGQPHILVDRPMAPPQLLPAELVAVDWEHDVAVLRATPNPFEGKYAVTFLPLTAERPLPGTSILAMALRPSRIRNPHTFEMPVKEQFDARVLNYQFTQEEKGAGDTELFLFSHEVLLGQSGAPVLSANSREVVGFVDGRWLHPGAVASGIAEEPLTPTLGAAVRIHYAIALLREKGIAWQNDSGVAAHAQNSADQNNNSSVPKPLSLVSAPFPAQSLSGGEVVFDALVNTGGNLEDIKVVRGDSPFKEKALSAMRTWTFLPACEGRQAIGARIGVTFQFPQTYLPAVARRTHGYEEFPANSQDRGALPVATVEPDSPQSNTAEGSVILFDVVDAQGHVISSQELYGSDSLTPTAEAAARQWRFAPGKHAGVETEAAVVIVIMFRHTAMAGDVASNKKTR